MFKQSWACLGYLCAPITETLFAELVRLSRTSIADEMREEHRRRVLGDNRSGQREAARLDHCPTPFLRCAGALFALGPKCAPVGFRGTLPGVVAKSGARTPMLSIDHYGHRNRLLTKNGTFSRSDSPIPQPKLNALATDSRVL